MAVDLKTCKYNDWLRLYNGDLAQMVKRNEGYTYPAVIEVTDTGRRYTILDDGRFWYHEPDNPHDYDVVEILGAERPINELPTSLDRASFAEAEVFARAASAALGIPSRILLGTKPRKTTKEELLWLRSNSHQSPK